MASLSGQPTTITALLKRFSPGSTSPPSADEIASAIRLVLAGSVSDIQTAALLTALHFSGVDRRADVLAACASAVQSVSETVDIDSLRPLISQRAAGYVRGEYRGGLIDVVGTGGDSHNTFNVSTTAAIIASACVLVAKHGNKASTSSTGSADILASPVLRRLMGIADRADASKSDSVIKPTNIVEYYGTHTNPHGQSNNTQISPNFGFLFAPVFHPSLGRVAAVRRELGWRTVFNLLGPLVHPLASSGLVEARLIGVARRDIGHAYADAFGRIGGSAIGRTIVVCGAEELDEISCAGPTFCWAVRSGSKGEEKDEQTDYHIESFTISPTDFGLPIHPLTTVRPGKNADENATFLASLLSTTSLAQARSQTDIPSLGPIIDYVLLNAAAALAVSGVCDVTSDEDDEVIVERGPGGYRWKEGVRLATKAIESGQAREQLRHFLAVSANLN